MIAKTKDLLMEAREGHYGVGAFNIEDYSTVEAVCLAAEKTNCPVILQVGDWIDPEGEKKVMGKMRPFDYKNLMAFLRYRAEASPVPIAINLDHCTTFDGCLRAIQHGATSVMIDASMQNFEGNAALTKKVVESARGCDVAVEAEIGHVGGHFNSTGGKYTSPDTAKAFYDATDVDFLAVSVGTVHGVYDSDPVLQYDLIAELREAIPSPLVMHGGSGLEPEQYAKCVENGITKINFATYAWMNGAKAAKEACVAAGDGAVYPNVNRAAIERMRDFYAEHIGYFKTKPIK